MRKNVAIQLENNYTFSMNYLIVVAHPDDELLGAGASISHLVNENNRVDVCILTKESPTREIGLQKISGCTHKFLGIEKSYIGNFGCMKLKDEDHFSVVSFIEECIKDCMPDVVITHHPSDLRNDHNITSICCQEACRLPQRLIGYDKPIKTILYMEVKSSTDWALNESLKKFTPNFYIEVSKKDIENKINAIEMYDNVIRNIPHSRSKSAIQSLAVVRGSECGKQFAEAFQMAFGVM